jgi:hypothetical protein
MWMMILMLVYLLEYHVGVVARAHGVYRYMAVLKPLLNESQSVGGAYRERP